MDYAIIKLGNKQHRVRDGETLVVDRVSTEAGESFEPVVLLGDVKVTATVVAHERGPKIVIGKYRRRTGYKRHNGFRAATSRLEIALGTGSKRSASRTAKPKAEAVEVASVEAAPLEETAVAPAPVGLPEGYDSMTVAEVTAGAKEWSHDQLEVAHAYEQEHAARKGAVAALESALRKDEEADS